MQACAGAVWPACHCCHVCCMSCRTHLACVPDVLGCPCRTHLEWQLSVLTCRMHHACAGSVVCSAQITHSRDLVVDNSSSNHLSQVPVKRPQHLFLGPAIHTAEGVVPAGKEGGMQCSTQKLSIWQATSTLELTWCALQHKSPGHTCVCKVHTHFSCNCFEPSACTCLPAH